MTCAPPDVVAVAFGWSTNVKSEIIPRSFEDWISFPSSSLSFLLERLTKSIVIVIINASTTKIKAQKMVNSQK
jgi:hypothetical protein